MDEREYLDWFETIKEKRKPILLDFYKSFFDSPENAENFIDNVYNSVSIDFEIQENECFPIPRNKKLRMMNNIQRFSSVMDVIEGKEVIKLFFLITCIESLYEIANKKLKLYGTLVDLLDNHLEDTEKLEITNGFHHSIADDKYIMANRDFDINAVSKLLVELRNVFAHEGIYWEFSFSNGDYPVQNNIYIIEVDEFSRKENVKKERTYDISITYEDLRKLLIKAMINFINDEKNTAY
jgi:hypothetical protein